MPEITLKQQIEYLSSQVFVNPEESQILTSLQRLQALESQTPVAWVFKTNGSDCNLSIEKPKSHYHPVALYTLASMPDIGK
jgi:hypothetical protein